jgi:hypothetical protein
MDAVEETWDGELLAKWKLEFVTHVEFVSKRWQHCSRDRAPSSDFSTLTVFAAVPCLPLMELKRLQTVRTSALQAVLPSGGFNVELSLDKCRNAWMTERG